MAKHPLPPTPAGTAATIFHVKIPANPQPANSEARKALKGRKDDSCRAIIWCRGSAGCCLKGTKKLRHG